MQLHELKRKTKIRKSKQVGRGGTRGKTSGRGTKGQKARAGRKLRPEWRDIIKRLPKKRGYHFNSFVTKPAVLNLSDLNKLSETKINPNTLLKSKVFTRAELKGGVKILGTGEIKNKVEISNCFVSTGARAKIEKAGGKVLDKEQKKK